MANLVAAVVFFLGIHFGVSGTALRGRLVSLIGEKLFRGLFALTSIAGLIWLIRAYATAPYVRTWGRLIVLDPLAQPLMLIAALFVVIGVSTPSPTTAGMESQLTRAVQVRGITRITRHPFLWGIALRETSNVPFAAILQRRNYFWPALREIGVVRSLIAVAIFAALFLLHGRLFGAPLT
jgi:uncharacterized membrane protein